VCVQLCSLYSQEHNLTDSYFDIIPCSLSPLVYKWGMVVSKLSKKKKYGTITNKTNDQVQEILQGGYCIFMMS